MIKRSLDCVAAVVGLALLGPLLLLAAIAVRLSSRGPILYRARRTGCNGAEFVMYKLRTMHVDRAASGGPITAARDPRVFAVGQLLRRTKLDELPQLVNVLRGDMSLVGPRPEDPTIVAAHFGPAELETLRVRPGLASPGSIYNYTHGERLLVGGDVERAYVEELLPIKLALDRVYVREASLLNDLRIVLRTAATILAIAAGRTSFADPPEMARARALLAETAARRSAGPEIDGAGDATRTSGRITRKAGA